MSMALQSSKNAGPTPTVNVTPLVDIALVVLIIFMLVTPLMTNTFWLNIPKEPEANQPPPPKSAKPPLVMTVDESGTIRINKSVVTRAELPVRLPRMLAAQDRQVLFFDATNGTPYAIAIETMDLARAAGARSIAILTEPVAEK